jgi:hypothetical protein
LPFEGKIREERRRREKNVEREERTKVIEK